MPQDSPQLRRDRLAEDLDAAAGPGCPGQASVSREEVGVEGLGQGHVGRVIDGQGGPQLPTPCQERPMRCPLDREVDQIGQGELGPSDVEVAPSQSPAED
jgi:hypothetical protein